MVNKKDGKNEISSRRQSLLNYSSFEDETISSDELVFDSKLESLLMVESMTIMLSLVTGVSEELTKFELQKFVNEYDETLWLFSNYRQEFDALPVVRYSRIAEICDYDMQEGPPSDKEHRRKCSLYPGYEPLGDTFIIKVYDWVEWRPKDSEMIEITNKEYLTIKAKASAKKKVKPQTVKAQ